MPVAIDDSDEGVAAYIWDRVMPEPNSGCWLWIGPMGPVYGRVRYGSISEQVHRVSWRLHNKRTIPDGLFACHRCDNPICANPEHIFVGSQFDNMSDCSSKGRNGMQRHPEKSAFNGPIVRPFGEMHGMAKLTEDDVFFVHQRNAQGASSSEIAREVGISPAHVRKLVAGRAWRRVAMRFHAGEVNTAHKNSEG